MCRIAGQQVMFRYRSIQATAMDQVLHPSSEKRIMIVARLETQTTRATNLHVSMGMRCHMLQM
jgi:hypothetical protein